MNPLRQRIEFEIRQRGPIPFSRYMDLCLYDPDHGYYFRNAEQFGKAGDFYTSSDVHAVFGRLMARQFEEMWRALSSPSGIAIVELGPGRALFAQDVLDWSEKKFPDFFQALRYVLVETSPALRQRIEATLRTRFDSGQAAFASFEEKRNTPVNQSAPRAVEDTCDDPTVGIAADAAAERRKNAAHGASRGSDADDEQAPEGRRKPLSIESVCANTPTILFANEFFDALPVEILSPQGSLRIDIHDGHFIETWAPASPQELEYLDRYSIHPEPGERIEAPLIAQHHMHHIASTFTRGFLIAIDYGYTREEQLAGRHRGTLKALRQHSLSANPYESPGDQDITADVNFTALAAAAQEHGMQTQELLTQSQFLMGIGESTQFADAFEDCRLPQEHAKVALQLKHLVTPAGMGESFHVLVACKGVETEKVAALAGLTFGHKQSASS
ncbi:MAG: SAM-dependent methyltransferase [Acidobacteriia bacterium]|nr:SAM-dependent methyltransferase [Terriglobia bacterium]